MQTGWMPLPSVLAGEELVLTDQSIWLDPLEEFGMDCRISAPVEARLLFLPQTEGLLVRGRLTGRVILPCKLCAEDAPADLLRDFDEFEPFPALESGAETGEALGVDGYFIRWSRALMPRMPRTPRTPRMPKTPNRRPGRKSAAHGGEKEEPLAGPQAWNGLEVNPGNLAWEEFLQALPQFPLCREDCAGLCHCCGHNLNQGRCGCKPEDADPRLEKLRGLKILK